MKKPFLKAWELALLISFSISLCAGVWASARSQAIASSLVRLHVVAVSDDDEEQEIKLRVRDAVLEYLAPELEGVETSAEAEAVISARLGGIADAAGSASEGRAIEVSLGEEYYPTRDYGTFSLPAGKYVSLRVTLGEGKGHNWWCVVFPPLCLTAAEAEEALDGLDAETVALITSEGDGVALKFRLVELWGELLEKLGG